MIKFKKYFEKQELLAEGVSERIQRYLPMFGKILQEYPEFSRQVNLLVEASIRYLKRDDIVSWFLVNFRNDIRNTLRVDPSKLGIDIPEDVYISYKIHITNLQHFLSLPISKISNYRFNTKETVQEVIDKFETWEEEWQKDNTGWIDITDELNNGEIDIIERFPDGFAWVDLNVPYCTKEGNAMGHCGNRAAYKADDKVLSLRKLEKRGSRIFSRPSLTFILHENGYLGEMKGRANEKPNPKYHPYILKLLMVKYKISSDSNNNETEYLIKGIAGGGYSPENNFSLNDLSESDKKKLYSIRKDLEPLIERYNREELDDYEIIEKLSIKFDVSEDDIQIHQRQSGNYVYIKKWDDWEDFLDNIDGDIPKNLKTYRETIENGYADWFEPSSVSEKDMVNFLDDTLSNNIIKNKINQLLTTALKDDPSTSPDSITDTDEIFNILNDWDYDFSDCIKGAISDGEESGVFSEIYKRFISGIENLDLTFMDEDYDRNIGSFKVLFKRDTDISNVVDSGLYISSSLVNALSIIDNDIDISQYMVYDGDMEVPYYGFNGFNEDVAINRFLEKLNEIF